MRKYLLFGLTILLTITITGCKKPVIDDQPDPKPTPLYTIEDFYDDLERYSERLDEIVSEGNIETKISNPTVSRLSDGIWDEYLTTITRDDILESHYNSNIDIVHDSYYENLLTTQSFVDTIKGIMNGEDIELNQDYFPSTIDDATFKFFMIDDNYILIDALFDTNHRYLKMGMNDDLLDYQEFLYYFDLGDGSHNDETTMNFSYFKFLEDKEAIHTRYSRDSSMLSVINIEKNDTFTISKGLGIIEGPYYEEAGYVLNRFDSETNSTTFLQVMNDEIIGETYDIFDEHGSVYRYDDYDNSDGIIRVQINFATATGWDYVVASNASNEEIDAETGIFTNDGTKIYDEWFNYTYTPTYGFLGLWVELESKEQLTNEIFSLNQYGMNLNHPKASIEYFNQIDLDNFDQIKDTFQIDNLDFFSDEIRDELYLYVDQDIRNALEGKISTPTDPIVTTGDILEFNTAFAQFNANMEELGYYITHGITNTSYLNEEEQVVASATMNEYLYYNVNELFFRYASDTSGATDNTYGYYIDGSTGPLLEFERDNPVFVEFDILEDTANTDNFNQAVNQFLGIGEANNAKSIKAIDEYTFEVTVDSQILGDGTYNVVAIFEQLGITGLEGQDILLTYTFNESFDSYDVSYTIDGLTLNEGEQSYDIVITSLSSTWIAINGMAYHPLENPSYKFYLPSTPMIDILVMEPSTRRVALTRGTQYLTIQVPIGEYEVAIYEDYSDTQITIYDKDMNEIPYDQRFESTYEGIYYVKIVSSTDQSANIYLRTNPTPQFIEFDFDSTDGELINSVSLEGNTWYTINVPSAAHDRLLMMNPYFIGEVDDPTMHLMYMIEELYIDGFCDVNPNPEYQETCYFYLPANYDIELELNGYYVGDFGIDYSYIEVPQGTFNNNHTWEDIYTPINVWLTEDSPEARVDFTITEAGEYSLETLYRDFGYSYQDAVLYQSDGTQVTYDWEFTETLALGDYYILFQVDYNESILIYIEAVIIKE
jgi:hypothetical protein